jgi:uncharacterized membrane protein
MFSFSLLLFLLFSFFLGRMKTAIRKLGHNKVIAVVMDSLMLNPSEWPGCVPDEVSL